MSPSGTGAPHPLSNSLQFRVAFGETDAAGVVFYPNYLRWFDRGSHELFRAIGLPMKELYEQRSVALPIVSVQADFRAPLRYDDPVELRSEIAEVTERSVKVVHTVLRAGKTVSIGWEIRGWVVVHGAEYKAEPIPEDLRQRLT